MELTRSEVKLMKIFWNTKRPLTRRELIDLNADPSWQMAALHGVINGLLKKGAIAEAGIEKSGKSIGRRFEAKFALEDYIIELLAPVDEFIDYQKLILRLLQKCE